MPYYAVAEPEQRVFDNWSDCQAFVSGRRAVFKKFATLEEAEAFAFRSDRQPQAGDLIAYTDGSYDEKNDECGSGAVFVRDDKVLQELSFVTPNRFEERNITGETEAVLKVIEACLEQGIDEIFIAHDLEHLGEWVRDNGAYRPNSQAAKDYVQRYQDLLKGQSLKIYFYKVKGHSGNKWNDYADRLAQAAFGH